MRLSPMLDRE